MPVMGSVSSEMPTSQPSGCVNATPLGRTCIDGKYQHRTFPVNLTYFVLIRARALTTSCGFCQASRQRSSNTFAYSPDDGG